MNLKRVLFGKRRDRGLIRRAISETNGAGKVVKIEISRLGCGSVAEHLPSVDKVLGSNTSSTERKERRKGDIAAIMTFISVRAK